MGQNKFTDPIADEIYQESIREGRLEMIVNLMEYFKQNVPEFCRDYTKKMLKATDNEVEKALKIVFGANYSEDDQ